MKKVLFTMGLALLFAGCSDDYTDWAQRYCPKKVCKLQSSYICVMNKKSTKNNEAYKRTKIGINF